MFVVWPTIGANSYVSVAVADDYLSLSINATQWTAASVALKEQALVSATRMLDRTEWSGEKTVSTQPLEWPRTGVTDRDGNIISSTTVPQQIQDAQCELALVLVKNVEAASISGTEQIKTIKTSETMIEFALTGKRGKYTQPVSELVSQFFDINSLGVPYVTGTDEESQFETDDRFDHNTGLA